MTKQNQLNFGTKSATEKSPKIIDHFFGNYRFLSNFWPAEVIYDGFTFPSVEHAYQAAKSLDTLNLLYFTTTPPPGIDGHSRVLTAGEAKRRGRTLNIRSDWEDVKISVMAALVYDKFYRHVDLREKLLDTKSSILVEGNTWGDRFWGVCGGEGQNHLGQILMNTRFVFQKMEKGLVV